MNALEQFAHYMTWLGEQKEVEKKLTVQLYAGVSRALRRAPRAAQASSHSRIAERVKIAALQLQRYISSHDVSKADLDFIVNRLAAHAAQAPTPRRPRASPAPAL